jgi:mono/diheme cytochrome c family protein
VDFCIDARLELKRVCVLALALAWGNAKAQSLPPEQIKKGAELYESHCQTCHGPRLANPPWAPDLRKFPREDRARFIDTVTYGRRGMPPWDDVLKPDDIEALWAYVIGGERSK